MNKEQAIEQKTDSLARLIAQSKSPASLEGCKEEITDEMATEYCFQDYRYKHGFLRGCDTQIKSPKLAAYIQSQVEAGKKAIDNINKNHDHSREGNKNFRKDVLRTFNLEQEELDV